MTGGQWDMPEDENYRQQQNALMDRAFLSTREAFRQQLSEIPGVTEAEIQEELDDQARRLGRNTEPPFARIPSLSPAQVAGLGVTLVPCEHRWVTEVERRTDNTWFSPALQLAARRIRDIRQGDPWASVGIRPDAITCARCGVRASEVSR